MKIMQIDRFEENFAVFVDDEDRCLNIPRSLFSCELHEGDIFEIEWDGNALQAARFLEEETEAQRARVKMRMERLKKKK